MRPKTSRNALMLQLARQGVRRKDLAERFGVSRPRVSMILRRDGFYPKVGRPRLPEMSEADRALYTKMRRYYGAPYARQQMGLD